MLSQNDKISLRQLQVLLILDIFGTGVLALPRQAAEYAGGDGWLAVAAALPLALFCAFLITTLGKRFPEDSFTAYTSKILSRPLGILISLGLLVKILLYLALELRLFGEILKETMLRNTPYVVVFFGITLAAGLAACGGYEVRARVGEILIAVVFLPFAIILILGLFEVDYSNLLPVMTTPPGHWLRGSLWAGASFTGLEFLLFAHPYVNQANKLRKGVLHTVALIGLSLILITVVTTARFGPASVIRQMWPVLEMMKMIHIPGSFMERQDALVMSFWIVSVFSLTGAGLFFSSLLIRDIAGIKDGNLSIFLCLPVIYILSLLPENINKAYELLDLLFITFGIGYLFVIPLLLLAGAKIRRLGEVNEED